MTRSSITNRLRVKKSLMVARIMQRRTRPVKVKRKPDEKDRKPKTAIRPLSRWNGRLFVAVSAKSCAKSIDGCGVLARSASSNHDHEVLALVEIVPSQISLELPRS